MENQKVNIAYLILAHNQAEQLIRLIDKLDNPCATFYIHLDKKWTDTEVLRGHFNERKNVTFISTHKIYWMGYNMVKSTLDLLKIAFQSGKNFKYYVLLSGQDYPIKDNQFINNFFDSHSEDFISYNRMTDISQEILNKFNFFHFLDIPYYNPRHPKKKSFLVKLYYAFHKHISAKLPKRTFYKGMVPYFGSQWFALTNDTVKYILEFLKNNKGYTNFTKFTEGPDEFFFQTIILNSECKHNLCDYKKYEQWLTRKKEHELFYAQFTSLRYMDWSEDLKEKPATLTESYLDTLKGSGDLFARKFHQERSKELLRLIDLGESNQ